MANPAWKSFRDDIVSRVTDWTFVFGELPQQHMDSRGWVNGLCPFHGETEPSFGFNPQTGRSAPFSGRFATPLL